MVLLAHHVDASFGNVTILPLSSSLPTGYTLTSDVNGNGNIVRNPDQATYAAGDVVTLEAVADQGWIFSGWSGAVDGNQNPVTVMMDADRAITATFVPER